MCVCVCVCVYIYIYKSLKTYGTNEKEALTGDCEELNKETYVCNICLQINFKVYLCMQI